MNLQIDPEVLAELAPLLAAAAEREPPPIGDVATRRANSRQMFEQLVTSRSAINGVEVHKFTIDPAVRCSTYTAAG